jgi:hypothetical protein
MSSRNSRRALTALTLSLLLTPSLALARPQAQTARRVAPIAQPGLIDLFRAGLTQLLAKIAPTSPTPPTSPSPDNGAGVRIDTEGAKSAPIFPVGNP